MARSVSQAGMFYIVKRLREIIRKMEQGVTEASLCRADDGTQYDVVKTRLSGCEAMVKEWLGYEIGSRLGLPIPRAEIVYMDVNASRYSVFPEAAALADCPGFGSTLIEPTDILTAGQVADVPSDERAAVLLFDWWIINGDRQDQNPNLLWLQHGRKLHVVDHNLAFGNDSPDAFWENHLFRRDRHEMARLRARMLQPMTGIIQDLSVLWNNVPEEWRDRCIIQLEQADKILKRCFDDSFWVLP